MRLADGEYEGGWEGDEPSGHGVLRWANGNEYEGAWLKGLKHGRGVLRWASGAVYSGEWWYSLADNARHVIGCRFTQDTRV